MKVVRRTDWSILFFLIFWITSCAGTTQSYETSVAPSVSDEMSGREVGGSNLSGDVASAEEDSGGSRRATLQEPYLDFGSQVLARSVEREATPVSSEVKRNEEVVTRRPLLIYEAKFVLAVFQVSRRLDELENAASKVGGYLVSRSDQRIQIRVPRDQFEVSVTSVLKMGDVLRREIKAKDVTAEFTDVSIRLKNALAVRARLQELLGQAKSVEEALKVETQLSRVTGEIERMKGRLKLLGELVSFSTITVEFQERTTKVQSRVELPFPWLNQLGLRHLLDL